MDPDQYLVIQSENFAAENYRRYTALFAENPEFLANHFSRLADGYAVMGVTFDDLREMLLHDNFRFIREAEALDSQDIDDILADCLDIVDHHYPGFIAALRAASPEADELISRSYLTSAEDKVARDFENGRFANFFRLVDNDNVSGLRDYFAALQSTGRIRDFIAMNIDNPAFTGNPDLLTDQRFGLLDYIERNGSDRAAEITSEAIHDYLDFMDYARITTDMPRIGAGLPHRDPPRPMPRPVIEEPSEPTEPEEPEDQPTLDFEFGTPAPEEDSQPPIADRLRGPYQPVIRLDQSIPMNEAQTRLNTLIEQLDTLPDDPQQRLAAVQAITQELETLANGLNPTVAAAQLGQALPPRPSVTDSELELNRLGSILQTAQRQSNPGTMASILSDAARQARISSREMGLEIERSAPVELEEESNLAPADPTSIPAGILPTIAPDFGAATRFAEASPTATEPALEQNHTPNQPNPVV
ncbi:MAG: hypothetical protein ACK4VI_09210 [Alphaproteobacteria bacterium]